MQGFAPDAETLAVQELLHKDLKRRFSEFATYDAGTFGDIGLAEAAAAFALCIVLPLLLAWLLA